MRKTILLLLILIFGISCHNPDKKPPQVIHKDSSLRSKPTKHDIITYIDTSINIYKMGHFDLINIQGDFTNENLKRAVYFYFKKQGVNNEDELVDKSNEATCI